MSDEALGRVVVDASVAVKWVVEETGSEHAVLLLERQLVAPDLICAEIANILWKKVRRRELAADEAEVAAQALEGADIEMVATRPYLAAATVIAVELDHPAYDGIYLAVAERLDLPLVTADRRLIAKVRHPVTRFARRVRSLWEIAERP